MLKAACFLMFVVLASLTVIGQSGEGLSDTIKVRGKGFGIDRQSALVDAKRDAVERAVGNYVDSEQQLVNEELIKDKVLVHSNAYIKDYTIRSEGEKGQGLYEVVIAALVKKQELTRTLRDAMPVKNFTLGDELKLQHQALVRQKEAKEEAARQRAEAERLEKERADREARRQAESEESRQKRDEDAAKMLKGALEGFNPYVSLLDVVRDDVVKPQVVGDEADTQVRFGLKLKVNEDRYFKVAMPRLRSILAQISLREPETVTYILEPQKSGVIDDKSFSFVGATSSDKFCNLYSAPKVERAGTEFEVSGLSFERPGFGIGLTIWLVESVVKGDSGRIRVVMKGYRLADESMAVWRSMFEQWLKVGMDFRAALLDKQQNPVTGVTFRFGEKPRFFGWGASLDSHDSTQFYVSPFFFLSAAENKGCKLTDDDKQRIRNLVRNEKVHDDVARAAYIHAVTKGFRANEAYRTAVMEIQKNRSDNHLETSLKEHEDNDSPCSDSAVCAFELPLSCSFRVLSDELSKISSVRVRVVEGKNEGFGVGFGGGFGSED